MTSPPLRPVRPAHPPAPYIGAKRRLAARLVELISQQPHQAYAEPFVGMGGVFLRRPLAPRFEAINDVNRDVATLFRILQRHYLPFMEMLRFQLTGRAEFDRLMATPPDTLTDLERAARFLYLQRTAFGGKVASRNFGVSYSAGARFNITRLAVVLDEVHARLAGTVIECLPWQTFISRYDRPGMLFYLDPPYWGSEGDYGPVFSRDEFEALAQLLAGLKGRFILSLNDVAPVRRLFARFQLQAVTTQYSLAGGSMKSARELIIQGP
jgi:DNA adenine methylase